MSKKTKTWLIVVGAIVLITIIGSLLPEEKGVLPNIETYTPSLFSSSYFEGCHVTGNVIEINFFETDSEEMKNEMNTGDKIAKLFTETPARIFYHSDSIETVKINLRVDATNETKTLSISKTEYEQFFGFDITQNREYYPETKELFVGDKYRDNISSKITKETRLAFMDKFVK